MGGYLLTRNKCHVWVHGENDIEIGLTDYKWYCFNGIPKFVMINTDRHMHETKADYFDMEYNSMNFIWGYPHAEYQAQKPEMFDEMKRLATRLSENIPHVRIDFYVVSNQIYFGEMTFFDGSGFDKFEPNEWDYKIGSMLRL